MAYIKKRESITQNLRHEKVIARGMQPQKGKNEGPLIGAFLIYQSAISLYSFSKSSRMLSNGIPRLTALSNMRSLILILNKSL